ncbi:MAG: glycosyltransferase family 2 protein [Patescibacteria group bacterium]|jgi:hypothetical protein
MNKISVIIVGYNSRVWLPGCFSSLAAQTHRDFEIIFVDNGSRDDSLDFIRANYPETIIIENHSNSGFAGGNNLGLPKVSGDYIFLFSPDAKASPTLLADLLKAYEEIPQLGCVQPKLIFMHEPDKLDSCGSYFTWTGFLKHIGNFGPADLPEHNKSFPAFGLKGAAMMFKTEMVQKAGGLFDNDYWCYFEETDFCVRVWLAGYQCWYYPRAVAWHAIGGSTGSFVRDYTVQYHSFKNRLATYLKTLSLGTLIRLIPVYLAFNFGLVIFFLLIGQYYNSYAVIKALYYNLIHLPATLRKRKEIQTKVRRVVDKEFLGPVTAQLGLDFKNLVKTAVALIRYERDKRKPCV